MSADTAIYGTRRPLVPAHPGGPALPVPFISGLGGHMNLDNDRVADCMAGACQVCGLLVDIDGFVVVVVETGHVLDVGPLHERCARQALRLCPHLTDNDEYALTPVTAGYCFDRQTELGRVAGWTQS